MSIYLRMSGHITFVGTAALDASLLYELICRKDILHKIGTQWGEILDGQSQYGAQCGVGSLW